MDKKQAADYVATLKPKTVIPTHYGSIVGNQTDGQDFEKDVKAKDSEIQVELKLC